MSLALACLGASAGASFAACSSTLGGASSHTPAQQDLLTPQARALVETAYAGIDTADLADMHVHIVGLGAGGTGATVNPHMQDWASPLARMKYNVYMSAARVENEENADAEYVARLVDLAQHMPTSGKLHILAFDHHINADGSINLDKSEFYTPNAYVFGLAEQHPDIFVPVMSVHPLRPDALEELERWAAHGGRLIKWLPNAMGIDPSDPALDAYYDKVKELGLVILTHGGEEQAVEAEEDQRYGNPLLLRRPLERGVKIIVAHCASLGTDRDLDDPAQPEVSSFQLFMRLMDEPKYEGLLFGEISAMSQFNRIGEPLTTLLERPDLHPRLFSGSDYPLPAINVVIRTSDLADQGYISPGERELLNEIYDVNPLLFDFVLKRRVRSPLTGKRFSPEVFTAKHSVLFGELGD